LNLGKLEQEDQAAGAQWLGALKYVDASRIGLWGWSFGGYLTSLCLVKSPDLFKMGMAVAPVTHWKYYDNIYTERYLRTPELNKMGYEENSPLNFTSSLKAKYLIVHGTADDNVHFQNATEMIKAMIKSGSNFDSEVYPNRNHGIGDLDAQKHLFRKLTTFVKENL
jgi:dipeptidyl-peptidase-4